MYKFKWKRKFIWHTENVVGHQFNPDQHKMILFFEKGGCREIHHWEDCELLLGEDWAAIVAEEHKK